MMSAGPILAVSILALIVGALLALTALAVTVYRWREFRFRRSMADDDERKEFANYRVRLIAALAGLLLVIAAVAALISIGHQLRAEGERPGRLADEPEPGPQPTLASLPVNLEGLVEEARALRDAVNELSLNVSEIGGVRPPNAPVASSIIVILLFGALAIALWFLPNIRRADEAEDQRNRILEVLRPGAKGLSIIIAIWGLVFSLAPILFPTPIIPCLFDLVDGRVVSDRTRCYPRSKTQTPSVEESPVPTESQSSEPTADAIQVTLFVTVVVDLQALQGPPGCIYCCPECPVSPTPTVTPTASPCSANASDGVCRLVPSQTNLIHPPGATHRVECGETLSMIARTYNTTVEAIIEANLEFFPSLGIYPDCIRRGWWLIIPSTGR